MRNAAKLLVPSNGYGVSGLSENNKIVCDFVQIMLNAFWTSITLFSMEYSFIWDLTEIQYVGILWVLAV